MRQVMRAAAASGLGTAAGILSGLVRVKLYAAFLGAAGLGLVSQITNLHAAFTVVSCLGLGVGVSKTAAEARGTDDLARLRRLASTAILTVLATGAVTSLALALAARPLARSLLGDATLDRYLIWSAAAVLFGSVGRIVGDLINGVRDLRSLMWSGILGSVLALSVTTVLVVALGFPGAVASLPLAALVGTVVAAALLGWRQRDKLFPLERPLVHSPTLAGLARIGLVSLAIGLAEQVALVLVRGDLIRTWGASANGHFQGVFGPAQQMVTMVIAFHGAHSFPRVCEARSVEEANQEIRHAVRATLLLLGAGAAGLVLARHLVVRVLLSPEFAASLPLFPWQLGGDLARGIGMAIGLGVLPRAGLRPTLALGVGGSTAFLAAYLGLKPWWGASAPSVAWCVGGLVYLVAAGAVLRRATGFSLGRRETMGLLLAAPLFWVLGRLADGSALSYAVGAVLIGLWLLLGVRRSEWMAVLRLFGGRGGMDP